MYARKCVNESLQVCLVSQKQIIHLLRNEERYEEKSETTRDRRKCCQLVLKKMPAGHPQFFTTFRRVFKPRVVNIRMYVYPHISRAYVSRDANSMRPTVSALQLKI